MISVSIRTREMARSIKGGPDASWPRKSRSRTARSSLSLSPLSSLSVNFLGCLASSLEDRSFQGIVAHVGIISLEIFRANVSRERLGAAFLGIEVSVPCSIACISVLGLARRHRSVNIFHNVLLKIQLEIEDVFLLSHEGGCNFLLILRVLVN